MFFKKRKKKRVLVPPSVIIELLERDLAEGFAVDMEILYNDEKFNLGISSHDSNFDYVHLRTKRRQFTPYFYINSFYSKAEKKEMAEQEFATLDDFKNNAKLGKTHFMQIKGKIEIISLIGEVPWIDMIFKDYVVAQEKG